jgi:hypothetical protein
VKERFDVARRLIRNVTHPKIKHNENFDGLSRQYLSLAIGTRRDGS